MDKLTSPEHSSIQEKLKAVESTRLIAAQSLHNVLTRVNIRDGSISEKNLFDSWLTTMRTHPSIFPDGWYIDPPGGLAVLAGTSDKESRMNYESLRLESMWSQPDIFLGGKNQMIYVYASPVDRETGMIGDFGMTIYLGKDQRIIDHLKRCLAIDHEIFDHVQIGMPFSEIYQFAEGLFKAYGLNNNVTSVTDPAKVNIGHTVPASYEEWTAKETTLLKSGEEHWKDILTMISAKRKFVNAIEQHPIQAGMAVTMEPRLVDLSDVDIPMSSFHTIMLFKPDGSKELLTNFTDL